MHHTVRWERDDRITMTFELSVGRNWLDLSHEPPRILLAPDHDESYLESPPTNLWCWTIKEGSSVLSKDAINVISIQYENHPGITLLSAYKFHLAGVDGLFVYCTNQARQPIQQIDEEDEAAKHILIDSQETAVMGSIHQHPPSKLSQLSTQSMEASPQEEVGGSSLGTSQFAIATGLATQMDDGSDTNTTDAAERSTIPAEKDEDGSDTDETVDTNTAKDLVRCRRSRQKEEEEEALRSEGNRKSLETLKNKATVPEAPPKTSNECIWTSLQANVPNSFAPLFSALERNEDKGVKEPLKRIGDSAAVPIDLECDGDSTNETMEETGDLKHPSSRTFIKKSVNVDSSVEDAQVTDNSDGNKRSEELLPESTIEADKSEGLEEDITEKSVSVVIRDVECDPNPQTTENCDDLSMTDEPKCDKLVVVDTTTTLTEVCKETEKPGDCTGHKPFNETIALNENVEITNSKFADESLKPSISREADMNLCVENRHKVNGSPDSVSSCVTQVADERPMQFDLEKQPGGLDMMATKEPSASSEKAVVEVENEQRQNQDATENLTDNLVNARKESKESDNTLRARKTRRETKLLLQHGNDDNLATTLATALPNAQGVGKEDTKQSLLAFKELIASSDNALLANGSTNNGKRKRKKADASLEPSMHTNRSDHNGKSLLRKNMRLPGLSPDPTTPRARRRQLLTPKTTDLDGHEPSDLDFGGISPIAKRFTPHVPESNSRPTRQYIGTSELGVKKAMDEAQDKRPALKRRARDGPRTPATSRKASRTRAVDTPKIAGVRILVTGVKLTDRQIKMVDDMGGEIVTDLSLAKNATHVIAADKTSILRTPKLMIALCRTTNIVCLDWLKKSVKHKSWLPCDEFIILSDKEAERRYDFSMKETLDRVKQNIEAERYILDGWNIFLCPGVAGNGAPTEEELKYIVEATGATLISSRRTLPTNRLLILTSDPETKLQLSNKAVVAALEQGAIKRSIKWFFGVTFKQKTDLSEA